MTPPETMSKPSVKETKAPWRKLLILAPGQSKNGVSQRYFFFYFFLMGWFLERGRGRERERKRETSICCPTYLCIHHLLLVGALIGDWTHNLGLSGQHSNQLSYPARAAGDILGQKGDSRRVMESHQKDTTGTSWQGQSLATFGTICLSKLVLIWLSFWITKNIWVYNDIHKKEN